ncbi:MAG: DUF4386 family protein [Ignavibacteria bacterium]|nr:DUF4386 family protein [Ignavibacteria bacterium]
MKNLQKAGGISALIAAATYLFSMALVVSLLMPMADSNLGFQEFMAFLVANRLLIFVWHFSMYLINGVCLAVLVLALYERLKDDSPRLAKIATVFGLFWTSFVFLSGLITIHGNEVLINLYEKDQANAANLRLMIETITMGIDNSDKLLGCLWVGLVSLSAYKSRAFPKAANIFGLAISLAGLIGIVIPALISVSYIFGVGAIVWWLCIGIIMLRKHVIVEPVTT